MPQMKLRHFLIDVKQLYAEMRPYDIFLFLADGIQIENQRVLL